MKKILLTALCFATIGIGAAHAQKPGKTNAETHGSSARQGKGVSKGSPIIQRQSGGTDDAKEVTSEEAPAPVAPPAMEQPKASPAVEPSPKSAPTEASPKTSAKPQGEPKPKETGDAKEAPAPKQHD